jgi:hypothetical protein
MDASFMCEPGVTRRRLIGGCLVAVAVFAAGGAVHAESSAGGPADFVRELYQREIVANEARTPMSESEFLAVFSRATRNLWQAGRNSSVKIPIGPKLHAFFGWGMLPGFKVTLEKVSSARDATGAPRVSVDLTVRGEPRHVYVHPVMENGRWRIANISYDHGEDLVSFRKRLSGR